MRLRKKNEIEKKKGWKKGWIKKKMELNSEAHNDSHVFFVYK
jgi:hypothetical protein